MRVRMLCDRLPLIREEFGRAISDREGRATHATASCRHFFDLFPSFFYSFLKNPLGGELGGGGISDNG